MPQGKVIAVQPLGSFRSALQDESAFSATRSYTGSSSGGGEQEGNIVYIGAYKDQHKICRPHKVEDVFWYEDMSGELKEGDIVKYRPNPAKTKNIGGAKDVVRLKGRGIHLPGGALSKVALLASLLLLVAVMNDTRR